MDEIRSRLYLTDSIFDDMDPFLLHVSTTPSTKDSSNNIREYLKLAYGSSDYERLEFLGDRVLDLVVTNILFKNFNLQPRELTNHKSNVVRNTTLNCFGKTIRLCDPDERSKTCADLVEALIGAVYLHLQIFPHKCKLSATCQE